MCGAWTGAAEAAGPWRGQVVDAATGEPLEGVIVLAVWDKVSPGMIHHRRDYHDVDEVVTDADGRFVVPERSRLTANPFVSIDGPNLVIFKPGYGRWRRQGFKEGEFLGKDEVWRRMEKGSVVYELPQLLTVQERRKALPSPPSEAPYSKIPKFMDAIDDEAMRIGLEPLRKVRPGGTP
jgi:hypothetical protein